MSITYAEAKRALASVKAHELAQQMNSLNCGVNWSGSTKGDMLQSLVDDYLGHRKRIVDRHGSFDAWAESITNDVKRRRKASAEDQQARADWQKEKRATLQAVIDTGLKLRRGETVDTCDRAKFFNAAISALKSNALFI